MARVRRSARARQQTNSPRRSPRLTTSIWAIVSVGDLALGLFVLQSPRLALLIDATLRVAACDGPYARQPESVARADSGGGRVRLLGWACQ